MPTNNNRQKFALICEDCYGVIRDGLTLSTVGSGIKHAAFGSLELSPSGMCPHCKRFTYFFSTDNEIAEIVSILNRHGYHTNFSCQGHGEIICKEDETGKHYSSISSIAYVSIHPHYKKGITKKLVNVFKKAGWTDVGIPHRKNGKWIKDTISLSTIDKLNMDDLPPWMCFYVPTEPIDNFIWSDIAAYNYCCDSKSKTIKYLENIIDSIFADFRDRLLNVLKETWEKDNTHAGTN